MFAGQGVKEKVTGLQIVEVRICAELSRRTFVSIALNKKRTALARTSKEEKIENNSAHSPRVAVFTQPGPMADVGLVSLCV
jgi:hypothetical protein